MDRIRLIVDKKEIPLDHLGIEDHCQFLLASTVSIKVLLQKIDKTLLLLTTFTTFLLREHIKKYGWMEACFLNRSFFGGVSCIVFCYTLTRIIQLLWTIPDLIHKKSKNLLTYTENNF